MEILLSISLLIVTAITAYSTYRISKLEAKRQITDVLPIIIPLKSFRNRTLGRSVEENFWTVYSLKNVGRGPAEIILFNYKNTNNQKWIEKVSNDKYNFKVPINLGPGDNIDFYMQATSANTELMKYEELVLKIEYVDILGNKYYTGMERGKTTIKSY